MRGVFWLAVLPDFACVLRSAIGLLYVIKLRLLRCVSPLGLQGFWFCRPFVLDDIHTVLWKCLALRQRKTRWQPVEALVLFCSRVPDDVDVDGGVDAVGGEDAGVDDADDVVYYVTDSLGVDAVHGSDVDVSDVDDVVDFANG